VLAFGEYVKRKYEIPPLPSTYEIAHKYLEDLWASSAVLGRLCIGLGKGGTGVN